LTGIIDIKRGKHKNNFKEFLRLKLEKKFWGKKNNLKYINVS